MSGLLLLDRARGVRASAWTPAPREYRGNMCGIRVGPGLPGVPGGARDSSLFLTWLYGRYNPATRAWLRAAYKERGCTDVVLSWPDERAVGYSPEGFAALCDEWERDGVRVTVMLASKDFDPWHAVAELKARIAPVLPLLQRRASRFSVWEMSIWLSPAEVQELLDWLAPQIVPWGGKLYVHFAQGIPHWAPDGPRTTFATFWNRNVGILTGILHQRKQVADGPRPEDQPWDEGMYQARLVDILERFDGNDGCSRDSGLGHPFDLIAWEITAMAAYGDGMPEAEQNRWGRVALTTPPLGVRVMGSGNGF